MDIESDYRRSVFARPAIACLLLCTALAARASDKADAIVRDAMRTHQIPRVCLGVVESGVLIKSSCYGYANVKHKAPVSPASLLQSGSVAKQFTATAVMMLVQDGKVQRDDPIVNYLP